MRNSDELLLSKTKLIKSLVAAFIFAGVILVTVILPAEFQMDPLGTGKLLGLDKFGADDEAPVEAPVTTVAISVSGLKERLAATKKGMKQEIVIDIAAGKGLEYKLHMMPNAQLQYEWSVEGGELFHDFHGEPTGDKTGYYESFTVATADKMSGLFYAPFDGSHGWYWKNRSETDMKITLIISGAFEEIGLKQ